MLARVIHCLSSLLELASESDNSLRIVRVLWLCIASIINGSTNITTGEMSLFQLQTPLVRTQRTHSIPGQAFLVKQTYFLHRIKELNQ